jgi:hypothetical protein
LWPWWKDRVLESPRRVDVLVSVMPGVGWSVVVFVAVGTWERGGSEGVVVPVAGRVEDADEEEERVSDVRPIARRNLSLRAMVRM